MVKSVHTFLKTEKITPDQTILFVAAISNLIKKGNSVSDSIDCAIYILPMSLRADILQKFSIKETHHKFGEALCTVFPNLKPYETLIDESMRVGELHQTLGLIAGRLKYEKEVVSQMKGAFLYPCILATIAGLTVLGMLIFIVPQVEKTIKSSGVKTGVISNIVFFLSDLLVHQTFILFIVILTILLVVIYYRIETKGCVLNFIYSNIFIYRIIADYELSLFWSYVSISYISSRDLENSFTEGSKTIKNKTVSHDLGFVGNFIGSNDKYFSENKFIGSDIIDYWSTTIRIHIKSGALDEVFLELADFHRTRNEERIKIISKLSEPVAMLVIGGIIGIIAIAILSPFYEITQGISSL